ncbi:MAG: hypothetical protein HDR75_04415 [Bacteroides sp.]|nr:hypothetical protein [Bacteroides sp.]
MERRIPIRRHSTGLNPQEGVAELIQGFATPSRLPKGWFITRDEGGGSESASPYLLSRSFFIFHSSFFIFHFSFFIFHLLCILYFAFFIYFVFFIYFAFFIYYSYICTALSLNFLSHYVDSK